MLHQYLVVTATAVWYLSEGVHASDRIAPGKFRFSDEILYLKDEDEHVLDLKPEVNVKPAAPAVTETKKTEEKTPAKEQKTTSAAATTQKTQPQEQPVEIRTQSVGYTVDSYPNPATNPGLCIQSPSLSHNFVCDPDGILIAEQQTELNDLLRQAKGYRIFAVLARSILLQPNQNDVQTTFAKQLLKAWDTAEVGTIILVYVENMEQLKIVTNVAQSVLPQEDLSKIEKDFYKDHSEVFNAIKKAVEAIEARLLHTSKGYIYLALFLAVGVGAYLSHGKLKKC
ncbi:putative integral membrane protein [Babesia bovis T2Bo]|uniref:putative integral membrane protein n=1 Tax=Babesia bovis T2Bo TaxID=484906 RepID=UPI001D55D369|nr:putative integral membrane protein [Babesia bovis T2Bo]EDO07174.2 putative integral membrane protein [Babesia bovis T2Bo]